MQFSDVFVILVIILNFALVFLLPCFKTLHQKMITNTYVFVMNRIRRVKVIRPDGTLVPKKAVKFTGNIRDRVEMDSTQLGSMYVFDDGPQQILAIGNLELSREYYKMIFRTNTRSYPYLGYVFEKLLSRSIGANTGKNWEELKKPLTKFFTTNSLKMHYDMIVQNTENWLQETFDNTSDNYENNICERRLQDVSFDKLTVGIIATIIFGDITEDDLHELRYLFKSHNHMMTIMGCDMNLRVPNILRKFNNTKNIMAVDTFWERWSAFNDKFIKNPQENSLLFTLLENTAYSDRLTLIHTLYEIALFNLDIMIDSFANLLWNVGSNPDVQELMFEECKPIPIEDFQSLNTSTMVKAVINESARLAPGVTLTFAETVMEPVEICGYRIPAGTKVSIDTQMVNRDPQVWENPHDFDPNRFIKDSKLDQMLIHNFHRFGLGPRKCLGNIYGDYILMIGIIMIIKKFKISIKNNKLITEQKLTIPNISNLDMTNTITFTYRQ